MKELRISPSKNNFNKEYFVETFDENGNLSSSYVTGASLQFGFKFLFKYDSMGYLIKEQRVVQVGIIEVIFKNIYKNNQLIKIINEKEKDTILYEYEDGRLRRESLHLIAPKSEKIFGFSSEYNNFNFKPYFYAYSYGKDTIEVKNIGTSKGESQGCIYNKAHLLGKGGPVFLGEIYIYQYFYYRNGLLKKASVTYWSITTRKQEKDLFFYRYR